MQDNVHVHDTPVVPKAKMQMEPPMATLATTGIESLAKARAIGTIDADIRLVVTDTVFSSRTTF